MSYGQLGQVTKYIDEYCPSLLCPIARSLGREHLKLPEPLPFFGVDTWNAYELSWLNPNGKPIVVCATFTFPCSSMYLIESKSFKLYLNSFNQSNFDSAQHVSQVLEQDLSSACGAEVLVDVKPLTLLEGVTLTTMAGVCLDDLPVVIDDYVPNSSLLEVGRDEVDEVLVSHLLKSNCPVTNQPDWGSVQISYQGPQIDRLSLLQYIVSFRQHQGFHEQCVEQIFYDLWQFCRPKKLTVYARYTRRGGLDINPFRTNDKSAQPDNLRLVRQ